MNIDTGTLFDGLKRIKDNRKANANEALISYAQKNFLHETECKFLIKTMNKRKLTDKQLAWKEKVNNLILNEIVVKRRTTR